MYTKYHTVLCRFIQGSRRELENFSISPLSVIINQTKLCIQSIIYGYRVETMSSEFSTMEPPEAADYVASKLSILDYGVFCSLMLVSALIGVYFAFFAKQKQNTTAEYLMGGKNMAIFPITMSLIARYNVRKHKTTWL
jgi:hypothetical protein